MLGRMLDCVSQFQLERIEERDEGHIRLWGPEDLNHVQPKYLRVFDDIRGDSWGNGI